MKTNAVVTFQRVANGEFYSFLDGEKTNLRIYNGCAGFSGSKNIYVMANGDTPTKVSGTLQMCKKAVAYSLQKRAAEAVIAQEVK